MAVERIARDALTQVRAAVRGYRSAGFASELKAARETLETAGIQVETQIDAPPLSPAQEGVIALALREAVTNVVRHAQARVYGTAVWKEAMVQMNRHYHSQAEAEECPDEPGNPGVAAIGQIRHRSRLYHRSPARQPVELTRRRTSRRDAARSCGKSCGKIVTPWPTK